MNTKEINTINNTEIELSENDLEEVNGGLICELAVAGAALSRPCRPCRPRPSYYSYEYTYYHESGYRW